MEPSLVRFGAGIDGAYNGTLVSHQTAEHWAVNFTGLYYNYEAINPSSRAVQQTLISTERDFLIYVDQDSWTDGLLPIFQDAGFYC